MDMHKKSYIAVLFLSFFSLNTYAEETAALKSAVETRLKAQKEIVTSQKKVETIAIKTKDMVKQYRDTIRKSDSINTYNKQLAKLIRQQKNELTAIQRQLDNADETQRNIVPLMLKMIDTLEQFIGLDLPFLLNERQNRVAFLQEIMDRADVNLPDKYRRIMEAYQIEIEYGRTIETYTDTIALEGQEYTVDVLRVGRLLLAFQTLDGKQSGSWDKETKSWKKLSSEFDRSISKGLQIAKRQAPPELIKLPVSMAGE